MRLRARRVAVAGMLAGAAAVAALATEATPPAESGLDALEVQPETDRSTYHRDAFGHSWSTTDGCDTRQRVLFDESLAPPVTASGCRVVAGEWFSIYDGQTIMAPRLADIDHLVPLAEAWVSGASTWTPERRRAYANDLGHDDALLAVSATTNRSKADNDPAEWLPPETAVWCRYATSWVAQKAAWALSVDQAEHERLASILTGC